MNKTHEQTAQSQVSPLEAFEYIKQQYTHTPDGHNSIRLWGVCCDGSKDSPPLHISLQGDKLLTQCFKCEIAYADLMAKLGISIGSKKSYALKPKPTDTARSLARTKADESTEDKTPQAERYYMHAVEYRKANPILFLAQPYAERKGLVPREHDPIGLGTAKDKSGADVDVLMVGMHDAKGHFKTYQRIFPDGMKKYAHGTAKGGAFTTLKTTNPHPTGTVYLCEGYADASVLRSCTLCQCYCAGDAGNMFGTVEAILSMQEMRRKKLCIVLDNDKAGMRAGCKIAEQYGDKAHGIDIRYHYFPRENNQDAWDIYTKQGVEALYEALYEGMHKALDVLHEAKALEPRNKKGEALKGDPKASESHKKPKETTSDNDTANHEDTSSDDDDEVIKWGKIINEIYLYNEGSGNERRRFYHRTRNDHYSCKDVQTRLDKARGLKLPTKAINEIFKYPSNAGVDTVGQCVYNPTRKAGEIYHDKSVGLDCYNTFKPCAIPSKEGDISPLTRLLEFTIPDEAQRTFFVQMWAHMKRHAGEKFQFIPVIKGQTQGTGKSTLGHAMLCTLSPSGDPINEYNACYLDMSDLERNWTDWAAHLQFGIIDDFRGNKEGQEKLERLVTSKRIKVEFKGCTAYQVPLFANFMGITNDVHAWKLNTGDRRPVFIDARESKYESEEMQEFKRFMAEEFAPWLGMEGVPLSDKEKESNRREAVGAMNYYLERGVCMDGFKPYKLPDFARKRNAEILSEQDDELTLQIRSLVDDPDSFINTYEMVPFGAIRAHVNEGRGTGQGSYPLYNDTQIKRSLSKIPHAFFAQIRLTVQTGKYADLLSSRQRYRVFGQNIAKWEQYRKDGVLGAELSKRVSAIIDLHISLEAQRKNSEDVNGYNMRIFVQGFVPITKWDAFKRIYLAENGDQRIITANGNKCLVLSKGHKDSFLEIIPAEESSGQP